MDKAKNQEIAYAELVNKCWEDPGYLAKFKADPAAALKEFGIEAPENATYHIVAPADLQPNTDTDIYLPYEDKPALKTMGDDTLDSMAGGGFMITSSNIITNKNAIAANDIAVDTEAAAVVMAVEVAYG